MTTGLQMACARCQKVLALEVTVDGTAYDAEAADEVEIGLTSATPGFLLAVCLDCMTAREAWHQAMRSAARLLDVAEAALADYDMVLERVPALRDDPEAKSAYASAQARAAEARAMLDTLREHEPAEDDGPES